VTILNPKTVNLRLDINITVQIFEFFTVLIRLYANPPSYVCVLSVSKGGNIKLSATVPSGQEVAATFDALRVGGEITLPPAKTYCKCSMKM
jgi:hypothetical protein